MKKQIKIDIDRLINIFAACSIEAEIIEQMCEEELKKLIESNLTMKLAEELLKHVKIHKTLPVDYDGTVYKVTLTILLPSGERRP